MNNANQVGKAGGDASGIGFGGHACSGARAGSGVGAGYGFAGGMGLGGDAKSTSTAGAGLEGGDASDNTAISSVIINS